MLSSRFPSSSASSFDLDERAAAEAQLKDLPAAVLNTGYYERFFVEERQLGSGSFGAVFLCQHKLDDVELGEYAVKKVPVGDNKDWLKKMIREVGARALNTFGLE